MMLLGLAGKKQSGKDTTANYLLARGDILFPGKKLMRFAFADALKRICGSMFDIPRDGLHGSEEDKAPYRGILQRVGMAFRDVDPDVWVKHLMREIEATDRGNLFAIITDVRFRNEVDAITARGGLVVRLTRGLTGDTHPSETELDGADLPTVDNRTLSPGDTGIAVAGLILRHYRNRMYST